MHDLAVKQSPSGCGPTLRNDWYSLDVLREFVGEAVDCYTLVHAVPFAGDITPISLAQPGSRFELEYPIPF